MSDCQTFEETLARTLDGEVDGEGQDALLAHCQACSECRQLLALHRTLSATNVPEPDPSDFETMRRAVHDRRSQGTTSEAPGNLRSPVAAPWQITIRPLRLMAGLAAATLLFAVGLTIGRMGSGRPMVVDGRGLSMDRLIRAIGAEAASNRGLADVEDARFLYSNVSFRRAGEGQIAVDFDVTTHVGLVQSERSALVEELVAQSLLNRSTMGTRLKAISYAADSMGLKVIEAVIFAMRHDESLAVRLQALMRLSSELADPKVESAVMATLRDDASVQVRLLALEYLAEHRVDHERLQQAIETSARPDDRALMVRLTEYEQL